jgi:hypothetical protein
MFLFGRKNKKINEAILNEFRKLMEDNLDYFCLCTHYISADDMDESEKYKYDLFEADKLMLNDDTPEEVAHRITEIAILYPKEAYTVIKDYIDYDFKIYPNSKPIEELIGESIDTYRDRFDPEEDEYELAEFETALEENNGLAINFNTEPFKYVFCWDLGSGDIGIAEMVEAVYVYERERRIIDTEEARKIQDSVPEEYVEEVIALYIRYDKSILSRIEKKDSKKVKNNKIEETSSLDNGDGGNLFES